ncbi:Alcohol dehydrogenase class-3 [Trichuris trichiura]|uniref:Alcohol dehydrogenase class-3 n=1 Tax=Trichuris trichiura TaxID=36087 RepID=A0A077Z259_TRITR|nr:Alcohol dehydrogenase class-3 [Trichuris trichiura]
MGADESDASMIIAIDAFTATPFDSFRARQFGAAHFYNPSRQHTTTIARTFECSHKRWAVSIILGAAPAGKEIVPGCARKGAAFGAVDFVLKGWKNRDSLSLLVKQYMKEALEADAFFTGQYQLYEICQAVDAMHERIR